MTLTPKRLTRLQIRLKTSKKVPWSTNSKDSIGELSQRHSRSPRKSPTRTLWPRPSPTKMAHGPLLVTLVRILPPIGAAAPSLVGGSRWVPGHIVDGPVVTEVLADGLSTTRLELVAGDFCSLFLRPLSISTEGRLSHEGGLIIIALRIGLGS